MTRESWNSRYGFIMAAVGSAIGLANIWKFPYMVGRHGGAAFIAIYLISLFLIGFPAFISEAIIGRSTQRNPYGAFSKLGGTPFWRGAGKMIVLTGFLVSAYYSVIAGQILGYLVEALSGNLNNFASGEESAHYFRTMVRQPFWTVGVHACFLLICGGIVLTGVKGGIERGSKWMMPLLITVLVILMIQGISLDESGEGLKYLFHPDWSQITPTVVLAALGHSFFTLSVGQGTVITYGSYLSKKENLAASCFPIVLMDTMISLMAATAIFTIVFSAGMDPAAGPGLIFHTLPIAFSQITGGYFAAVLFFLLVTLAAITSEISALEPVVAYFIDEKKWSRPFAVVVTITAAFFVGIPCALAPNLLRHVHFFGLDFFYLFDYICTSILIPLGGFAAVVLIGWRWGIQRGLAHLSKGATPFFRRASWFKFYFLFGIKYVAPILIALVFITKIIGIV